MYLLLAINFFFMRIIAKFLFLLLVYLYVIIIDQNQWSPTFLLCRNWFFLGFSYLLLLYLWIFFWENSIMLYLFTRILLGLLLVASSKQLGFNRIVCPFDQNDQLNCNSAQDYRYEGEA